MMNFKSKNNDKTLADIFGLSEKTCERLDKQHTIPFGDIEPGSLFVYKAVLYRKYPFNRELKSLPGVTGAINVISEFNDKIRTWFLKDQLVALPDYNIDSEWIPSFMLLNECLNEPQPLDVSHPAFVSHYQRSVRRLNNFANGIF